MKKQTHHYIIAVDGPAASGKSTAARALAERLGIVYVNSGMMYRAITYKCLQAGISPDQAPEIENLCKATQFDFKQDHFLVDGKDYSTLVSLPDVENSVSKYARLPVVRQLMTVKQRHLSQKYSIIMDGRDIGTSVFPDATYKFYLDASIEARAKRRYRELCEKFPQQHFDLSQISEEISQRDNMDRQRDISPLKQADDAIYLDTSELSIEETVRTLYNKVRHEQ